MLLVYLLFFSSCSISRRGFIHNVLNLLSDTEVLVVELNKADVSRSDVEKEEFFIKHIFSEALW